MKPRAKPQTQNQGPDLRRPFPVRFEYHERKQMADLADSTGLTTTAIIKMALRFSLPKFLSGEVSLRDIARIKRDAA